MADGINRVQLLGNLGQDPELRHTQAGRAVLTMRLATNESFAVKDGKEREERTEWHTVVLWGNRAEALSKLLSKGSRLFVEGRLQTRKWDDKEGVTRYSTEIQSTNVVLLGDAKGNRAPAGANDYAGSGDPKSGMGDDDIPF